MVLGMMSVHTSACFPLSSILVLSSLSVMAALEQPFLYSIHIEKLVHNFKCV